MENPALGGASGSSLAGDSRNPTPTHRKRQGVVATIRDRQGDRHVIVKGRNLWALRALIIAGAEGVTPISAPGPRWSAYVHKLRAMGFDISTARESHGGPFAGNHARYRLHSDVELEAAP